MSSWDSVGSTITGPEVTAEVNVRPIFVEQDIRREERRGLDRNESELNEVTNG
jgi:hypothetical protein